MRSQQPGPEAPSPQAAVSRLLHGQTPYDRKGPPVSLAPYQLERLSLPESVADCPYVTDMLPDIALYLLEGYQERMLEEDAVLRLKPQVAEYLDPCLSYTQKRYHQLLH